MYFYIVLFLIHLEWRSILSFIWYINFPWVLWKPLWGLFPAVRGFCSFPRESTCISYQGTAEALQEQQCTQTSKRQRLRLWYLFSKETPPFNSQTQHNMILKQSIGYQSHQGPLTYPSHCNTIDKCHIWLLAGACENVKETNHPSFATVDLLRADTWQVSLCLTSARAAENKWEFKQ